MSLSGGCKLYYWIEDPAAPTGGSARALLTCAAAINAGWQQVHAPHASGGGSSDVGPHQRFTLSPSLLSSHAGTILREYWNFPDPVVKTHAHNPCQSTGVWYLRPTPPAKAFMLAMTQRLSAPATRHQWDQTAWNEVILPFLWGNGEVEPLAYRLLPHAHYANVGVVDKRRAAGLPVDLVVLHSGYLHGKEKARKGGGGGYLMLLRG